MHDPVPAPLTADELPLSAAPDGHAAANFGNPYEDDLEVPGPYSRTVEESPYPY
jgi:hypothetical protein